MCVAQAFGGINADAMRMHKLNDAVLKNVYSLYVLFIEPTMTKFLPSSLFRCTLLSLSGAAVGLSLPALSWAQTAASASVVKIGGVTKRTMGKVTDMTIGDTACYVSMKDDQGVQFEELADFELCEKPQLYVGRRVSLGYTQSRVMAPACQGDPNCKKTQSVALVTSMKVIAAK